MNFAQLLSTYLAANVLVVAAYFLLVAITHLPRLWNGTFSSRDQLSFHYLALTSIILLALAHPFFPKQEIFEPMAKVWSAPSFNGFSQHYGSLKHQGYLALTSEAPRGMAVHMLSNLVFWVALLVTVAGLIYLLSDLWLVLRTIARAYRVRRLFDVGIYVSNEIRVPFSFWLPGRRAIVVPESILGSASYRIAVLHELQHHRQFDTKWVYVQWAMRIIFVFNPIIHFWNRWVSEIQEFACDEALVASRKVDSRAYAGCLLQVAETAIRQEPRLVCATGLTFLLNRKTLKRRITNMLEKQPRKASRRLAIMMSAALVALLGATAFASQGLIQDKRISLEQANELANGLKRSRAGKSDFPVIINDRVVKWLNYFAGTPEGRAKVRDALQRMEQYRSTIERKFEQYRVPEELMAIPFIESGFKNIAMTRSPYSAGLWMFIPSSARQYGMRVDDEVDERLNVEIETDAAIRYLYSERLRLNDWLLAALSYNGGDKKLKTVMNETGSRDPWVLIRSGLFSKETEEYVPKMMAGILILRNQELVR